MQSTIFRFISRSEKYKKTIVIFPPNSYTLLVLKYIEFWGFNVTNREQSEQILNTFADHCKSKLWNWDELQKQVTASLWRGRYLVVGGFWLP